jgi:hypothetical protein
MQRQREAAIVEAVIGDNASLAMGQYIAAQNKFGIALNANSTVTGAAESAHNLDVSAELASKKAFAASQVADAMMSSDLTGGAYARQRADTDLRKELFDAMEVDFTASSPTSLNKPYVVMVTRFHERDAKPGVWRNAIYAKALDPISGNSQKIHLLQGGFPRGFVVENCEIHLYNQGVEIPSDASPKRVSLSPSEAFEYLKIEYLSSHKGASHPAAPALGKLSAENRSKLSPAQLGEVYFVKVSPDGLPIAIFADEACSRPVDPVVGSVAENIRFYPALENGKRVEGVARLVLANISI